MKLTHLGLDIDIEVEDGFIGMSVNTKEAQQDFPTIEISVDGNNVFKAEDGEDVTDKPKVLNTVNVVEYFDGSLKSLYAWPDDEEGNKKAEDHFDFIIRENGFIAEEDDLDNALDEGMWENTSGYQAFIIHNQPIDK